MAALTEESLKLFIHRGVSFCDGVICTHSGQLISSSRWLYSKHRFKSQVEKLISVYGTQINEVILLDEFADRLSGLRIGGSVAPVFPKGLEKLTSQLHSSPIHSESVILTKPSEWSESWMNETLNVIKDNGIKRLSWHCSVPENVTTFFRQQGFENFELEPHQLFDLHQWRRNLLNASCSGPVLELTEEIQTVLNNMSCKAQLYWLDENLQRTAATQNRYGLTSAWTQLVYRWAQKKFSKIQDVFVLDWDGCFKIGPPHSERWTPWGPVACPASLPNVTLFEMQPTQSLGKNLLGDWSWNGRADQFEPGPLFLGRGLKPTVVDLIANPTSMTKLFEVRDNWSDRLDRELSSICGLRSNVSLPELKKHLRKIALEQWGREIFTQSTYPEIFLIGPFAEDLLPVLSESNFKKIHLQSELPNLLELFEVIS
jgi:hypothetical protein